MIARIGSAASNRVMHASKIPFGACTQLPIAPPATPARAKGEIIVRLLRRLVASRRTAATWRELTHHALTALADVTRERDALRRKYHALLDERRRERAA